MDSYKSKKQEACLGQERNFARLLSSFSWLFDFEKEFFFDFEKKI